MLQPVSIRINILSNFLIVIVLISTALLALQYYFSQQLALSAAHNYFIQTTKVIAQHIQSRDRLTKNMLNYTELYPNLTLAPGKAE
ncbi:hypothetical protein [sulfur-oxidizing endosymbiont of Gigantopelta aegis]|uniref:hypothetical protein n=1 Tax=sulfur-oxidizing endosymbiont of Gigantopelta aegis TaxID=2794934 RepID=UPI0018DD4662|nr:hypothetical protein [sulfur-oxidizing endosymbiont of Gigantopelta aegis]